MTATLAPARPEAARGRATLVPLAIRETRRFALNPVFLFAVAIIVAAFWVGPRAGGTTDTLARLYEELGDEEKALAAYRKAAAAEPQAVDEGVARSRLVHRYLRAFGPASAEDAAWLHFERERVQAALALALDHPECVHCREYSAIARVECL